MNRTTILTCLPTTMHDGRGTLRQRETVYAMLRAAGVAFTQPARAMGYWYGDDGKLYQEPVERVVMTGSVAAIDAALRWFGEHTHQYEMLRVTVLPNRGHIVDGGFDAAGDDTVAAQLAREHGGATKLPGGEIEVYRYASLVGGIHYHLEAIEV